MPVMPSASRAPTGALSSSKHEGPIRTGHPGRQAHSVRPITTTTTTTTPPTIEDRRLKRLERPRPWLSGSVLRKSGQTPSTPSSGLSASSSTSVQPASGSSSRSSSFTSQVPDSSIPSTRSSSFSSDVPDAPVDKTDSIHSSRSSSFESLISQTHTPSLPSTRSTAATKAAPSKVPVRGPGFSLLGGILPRVRDTGSGAPTNSTTRTTGPSRVPVPTHHPVEYKSTNIGASSRHPLPSSTPSRIPVSGNSSVHSATALANSVIRQPGPLAPLKSALKKHPESSGSQAPSSAPKKTVTFAEPGPSDTREFAHSKPAARVRQGTFSWIDVPEIQRPYPEHLYPQ